MVFLLKDIRLHLERWSLTRVQKFRLRRLMVLSIVSKGWNLLVKGRLSEEWRKSVPSFLQCSPKISLADSGTPKETQFPKAGIRHWLMMRCINFTDFWCTTHLGVLPRPLTAVEMTLAAEQANAPSSASFPAVRHHWDRLEEGVVEAIIAKALPIPHHQLQCIVKGQHFGPTHQTTL